LNATPTPDNIGNAIIFAKFELEPDQHANFERHDPANTSG